MALTDAVAVARTTIKSQKWNNVPYLLGGAEGFGDFVALTQYNSDTTPALRVKNLNAAGTHLDVLGSDGNPRLRVTDTELTLKATGQTVLDNNGMHTNFGSTEHPWYAGAKIDLGFTQTHGTSGSTNARAPFRFVVTDASLTPFGVGEGLHSSFVVETIAEGSNPNPAAYYAMGSAIRSSAVRGRDWDQVALFGLSHSRDASNARARALYTEACLTSSVSTAQAISAEMTTQNQVANTTAPDWNYSNINGATIGIALESSVGAPGVSGAQYTTCALPITGVYWDGSAYTNNALGAWKTGIGFGRNSVAQYGIDFAPLAGGTLPNAPIRIHNQGVIAWRNAAGDADLNGIGVDASNILYLYNSTGLRYQNNAGSTTYLNASPPTLTWNGTGEAGSMSALTVANADNTAAASAARIRVSVGGATSTSDPWVSFLVTNTTEYVMGIDNSVTTPVADPFMICVGAAVGSGQAITVDTGGNVVIGSAALATNATSGFLYVPSGAGAPSGTPTTYTGRVPMYVDTTNSFLYFYIGGSWKKSTVYA